MRKWSKVVIVTGGRDYDQMQIVSDALESESPDLVIQGGACGADTLARRWASNNRVSHETYEADWVGDGRSAGPIRNRRMVERGLALRDEGSDVIVLRFPGGPGTRNMERTAIAHGLKVRQVGR